MIALVLFILETLVATVVESDETLNVTSDSVTSYADHLELNTILFLTCCSMKELTRNSTVTSILSMVSLLTFLPNMSNP
ncbi:hypothetical protein Hanom_Chr05g00398031 [Helianthus anomalus]